MKSICPNCTNEMKKEKIWDTNVSCQRCGNDWIRVPKYCKVDYLNMIDLAIMESKISKDELSFKLSLDISELKNSIKKYTYFDLKIYKDLAKVTNKTIEEITEPLLIRIEEFKKYKIDYLKREVLIDAK